MRSITRFIVAVMLGFMVGALSSREVEGVNTNSTPSAGGSTNSSVREVSPGIFEIGKVQLNQKARVIRFPASINMTNGPVEYALVTAVGKLHESVLRTDIDAAHIHVAALLLGAKGAQSNYTVAYFDTNSIPGERVNLYAAWKDGNREKKVRVEDLVFNTQIRSRMIATNWVYNGSQIHDGTFIAQRDGLIVSIISDPLALINNPRPGHENDEIWQVNTNIIPPIGTKVEFSIEFP